MMTLKPPLSPELFALPSAIKAPQIVSSYPQLPRQTSSADLSPGQANFPRLHGRTNEHVATNKFLYSS